jgi:hypothetical protein
MKTKIVISKDTAKVAAKELTKLFPKLKKEPEYSIGFQRWSKLKKSERQAVMVKHSFDYTAALLYLESL